MDIQFSFNIPHALIEALGITEDTPFVISFEDGRVTVEPILDENKEIDHAIVTLESENKEWYEEGYDEGYGEGFDDGYLKGYSAGYDDGENGRDYNGDYPDDCGIDCDYDCQNCPFYNADTDTCEVTADDEEGE